MSLFTFIAGMFSGITLICVLVAIFDFDVKIEFITGKSARISKDTP